MMGALLIIVIVAVMFGRGHNTPPVIDNILADPSQVTVDGTTEYPGSLLAIRSREP